MDPYDPNQLQQTPRKQGMGCFAKGCLTLVAVGLVMIAILGFFGYKAYRTVADYIADHPENVAVYPATDAQYQAVQEKIAPFAAALESNRRETLELTGQELNILVARDPNFAHLKGKTSFAIANDEIVADVSTPLDDTTGRPAKYYFNGKIGLGLSVSDGEVELLPHSVIVNGKPLPGWAMQFLKGKEFKEGFNKSFNESFDKNPKVRALLSKLHSATVVGDKLILTSVGEPAVAPAPTPQ